MAFKEIKKRPLLKLKKRHIDARNVSNVITIDTKLVICKNY